MPLSFALRAALLGSLCVLAVACASRSGIEPSGYLGDYSDFEPRGDGTEALVYRRPGLDLAVYHKVIVDRVVVALA